MDEESKEVLLRVEENDRWPKKLLIGDDVDDMHIQEGYGIFNSSTDGDFTKLGQYIAHNTHVADLLVNIPSLVNVNIRKGFYDGLRQNYAIKKVVLLCTRSYNVLGDVGNGMLRAYQENSRHLTKLSILRADLLQNELVALTLRSCSNLKSIKLYDCNITDSKLLPIVEAIRGHSSLEHIYFNDNIITNTGCEALATLLSHPNCNLQEIQISNNFIGNEGAIILARSLTNNRHLRELDICNAAINSSVEDVFCKVLCNTTSIGSTYMSNHTLFRLRLYTSDDDVPMLGQNVASLIRLNTKGSKIRNRETANKEVAMKKILEYHPNIDMEPLFDWDSEDECTLKSLPYVIDWFDRAEEVDEVGNYSIKERKLSAIYQFARVMPLLFVPATAANTKGKEAEKKRKRDE